MNATGWMTAARTPLDHLSAISRLAAACVVAGAVAAHAAQSGDFECESRDTQITITGYTGAGGDVTVPSAIDGLPVTSIRELAP
jgi:hypothetical protein